MIIRRCGIYKIQSKRKPNRIYIGSAIYIKHRWEVHMSDLRRHKHSNIKLQRHYDKYGESDLQFTILLGCEKEDLLKVEQYFLDSYNPYFNILKIAGSSLGRKCSQEAKEKLRKAHLGVKIHNEESRKLIGSYSKGRPSKRRGMKHSSETIIKMRIAHTGKIKSVETRQKIRMASMGNKNWMYKKSQLKK